MSSKLVLSLVALVAVASATVYFQETFSDGDKWTSRWIPSKVKEADKTQGDMKLSAGKFYADAEDDKGMQTSQDARFYLTSASFPEFANKGKTLVLQYSIKHEQNIDCGGGYLKLLPKDSFDDPAKFSPDSKYNLMFGPDICGSTRKTHVIIGNQADAKNHLIKKEVRCESDEMTHLYTLVLRPNNTYEVKIDNVKVESGSLEEDWDIVAPKRIKDPAAKKPEDWVDEAEMDDPAAKKPEDWDKIPARIVDPAAKKPEDWSDETDGEWEAPTIANPEYKGEWKAPRIPNPKYKGAWVHPEIDNPDYKPMPELYAFPSFKYVAVEIWQVKSGSIYDNILVTDSEETAAEWAKKWETRKAGEKAMKDKLDEVERKKAEEAAKKAEAEKPKTEETKPEAEVKPTEEEKKEVEL